MAWNPGARAGLDGDTHWWVQWFWTDSGNLAAFKQNDDVTEFEFYNPGQNCGCNHVALTVRTAGHINPPPPGSFDFDSVNVDCDERSRDSLMEVEWLDPSFAELNTTYDLSVDAEMLTEDDGEANLTWEVDSEGPNWCDVWLAKVSYCSDNHLYSSEPSGICCSDRAPGNCDWEGCE